MMARLFRRWHPLRRRLDRLAWSLGLLGLLGVVAYNWYRWQQDKVVSADKANPPPLPPPEEWPTLPAVSVLVAAWNEAEHVERHVESFLALRYPHKELVLCAGGTDSTYELAKQYAGEQVAVLRQQPGEGKQRALARSFPQTRGDVIFLTDADCLLDDEAFERTLYPVAVGEEQVCTGSSRPLQEQLHNSFVVSQAATHLYSSLHTPAYASGLLGRNCAVRRDLLQRSRGLDAPASTGTDYVLAKELARCGARIRHVPQSQVITQYPTEPQSYMRQQRRWLRNVFLHGWRYGAEDEMRASLRNSLVGLTMLFLPPAALLLGPWLLVAWLVLAGQALAARLRYLAFAGAVLEHPVRPTDLVWQFLLLLLDFVAWIGPLPDYLIPRRRDTW